MIGCGTNNRAHPPPSKRSYVARLCRLAIESTWHAAHHATIHHLTDRRRRTMCERAETHDIARLPSKMQKITEQNRLQSYLLRLPLELRRQIYDYVYPQSPTLTISDSLIHNRYRLVFQDFTPFFHRIRFYDWCFTCFPSKNALALPLTCREIYTETIPYIYARNKFYFSDLRLVLSLPHVIPAKHLRFITELSLLFEVDKLIASFDLSEIPFVKDSKFVEDTDLAVTGRRKKYVQLWPFLSSTLVNIRNLRINFQRLEWTDAHREQQFCEWLMAPLLQSRDGKSVWSEKLARFEVRLLRRWESLVGVYAQPFTIDGGSQLAPFELRGDCGCKFGGWGCLCSEIYRDS